MKEGYYVFLIAILFDVSIDKAFDTYHNRNREIEDKQAKDLVAKGCSIRKAAKILHVSPSKIYRISREKTAPLYEQLSLF